MVPYRTTEITVLRRYGTGAGTSTSVPNQYCSFSTVIVPLSLFLSQNVQKSEHTTFLSLKLFTNEKRGGLRVISFDRPPFKLLSRKFSKESVQAPPCERHKTTQRTSVSDRYSFFPDPEVEAGDQYGSGSGSNPDPGH